MNIFEQVAEWKRQDLLEKGRKEGRREGFQKGYQEGLLEGQEQFVRILALLPTTEFPAEKFASLVGVRVDFVEKIKAELLAK